MDAQQELFTYLYTQLCEAFGEDNVFDDRLPPEGTIYPFVYMGDMTNTDKIPAKRLILADVSQMIHVYHNRPSERGTVSRMMQTIKRICHTLTSTGVFDWEFKGSTQNILPDTTTATPLIHGTLSVDFHLMGGN